MERPSSWKNQRVRESLTTGSRGDNHGTEVEKNCSAITSHRTRLLVCWLFEGSEWMPGQLACASLPGRGCPRDSRLGGDPKTTRDSPSMGAPTEGAWPLSKEEGGREGRCAFGHGSCEITELATVARHTDQSAGAISAGDVEPDTGRSSQLWGARAMSPPQRLIKSRTRVRLPHSERPASCWCVSASTTAYSLHFVFLLWYVPENSLEIWTSSSVGGRPSSSRLL